MHESASVGILVACEERRRVSGPPIILPSLQLPGDGRYIFGMLNLMILVTKAHPRIVARGISATIQHNRARVGSWLAILIHIDHTCGFACLKLRVPGA